MRKREGQSYYQIRIGVFWMLIGSFMLLVNAAYFKDDLYVKWLRSRGRETVSFLGVQSCLTDEEGCFLCGNNNYSIKEQGRQFHTVGVISLNDLRVIEFYLDSHNGGRGEITEDGGTTIRFGNMEGVSYVSKGSPARGMASIEITLPDDYLLDLEVIENNLCQKCLDKVAASLEYRKWKNEKKEVVPLCMVDFKTLEIYSLQDWHKGCSIRDYWVEIEQDGGCIELDIFYLPERGNNCK